VYIDGIPQLADPYPLTKPARLQRVPSPPDWRHEAGEAVRWDGVPPLRGRSVRLGVGVGVGVSEDAGEDAGAGAGEDVGVDTDTDLAAGGGRGVKFVNVKSFWLRDGKGQMHVLFDEEEEEGEGEGRGRRWTVLFRDGSITYHAEDDHAVGQTPGESGDEEEDEDEAGFEMEVEVVDLQGGSLAPGLTTFGTPIGLGEIRQEASTNDGPVPSMGGEVPEMVGGHEAVIRAVDGVRFEGRNMLSVLAFAFFFFFLRVCF
jgi:hypothetical protein